ncbi:uncharacterized protein BX664DRAFT_352097 [Halteromyces radiatus]|uniref:uncharacterized protein n=1 Tax=Halteromyces radiatus TaxID=101107 RepID=UPI00221F50B7|nr:uncharacterized protein BX664DRAFT_352097 [Halteromyces radiatus]KAI8082828.1 hypothetical protein BX664DRAFT_352097 [Halteromyces radiatus]
MTCTKQERQQLIRLDPQPNPEPSHPPKRQRGGKSKNITHRKQNSDEKFSKQTTRNEPQVNIVLITRSLRVSSHGRYWMGILELLLSSMALKASSRLYGTMKERNSCLAWSKVVDFNRRVMICGHLFVNGVYQLIVRRKWSNERHFDEETLPSTVQDKATIGFNKILTATARLYASTMINHIVEGFEQIFISYLQARLARMAPALKRSQKAWKCGGIHSGFTEIFVASNSSNPRAYISDEDPDEPILSSPEESLHQLSQNERENQAVETNTYGIDTIESGIGSPKTSSREEIVNYMVNKLKNLDQPLSFYGQDLQEIRFLNYHGRQKATLEMVKIFPDGGRKYGEHSDHGNSFGAQQRRLKIDGSMKQHRRKFGQVSSIPVPSNTNKWKRLPYSGSDNIPLLCVGDGQFDRSTFRNKYHGLIKTFRKFVQNVDLVIYKTYIYVNASRNILSLAIFPIFGSSVFTNEYDNQEYQELSNDGPQNHPDYGLLCLILNRFDNGDRIWQD